MKRLRVVGWNVQPLLMVDDGENLTPLEVQAQPISAAGWQAFKDGGDEAALDRLRQELGSPSCRTCGKSMGDGVPCDHPAPD